MGILAHLKGCVDKAHLPLDQTYRIDKLSNINRVHFLQRLIDLSVNKERNVKRLAPMSLLDLFLTVIKPRPLHSPALRRV